VIPSPDELSYNATIIFRIRNQPRPVTTVIKLQRVR
jgi:hypothetical protein